MEKILLQQLWIFQDNFLQKRSLKNERVDEMSQVFKIKEVLRNETIDIYEEEKVSGYIYTAILDLLDENDLDCCESEFDNDSYYLELSYKQFYDAIELLETLDTQKIQELSDEWMFELDEVRYTKEVLIKYIQKQLVTDKKLNLVFNIF